MIHTVEGIDNKELELHSFHTSAEQCTVHRQRTAGHAFDPVGAVAKCFSTALG